MAVVLFVALQDATVVESVEYFDVGGVTAAEIFNEMRSNGPNISQSGAHALAATHADYRHESEMAYRGDGRCATINLNVSLNLIYQIPRWTDEAEASDAVRAWWNALIERIWIHERGHAQIARDGARDLQDALLAAPSAANCDDLRSDLRRTMQRVLAKEIEPRQRQFDLSSRLVVEVSAR
jgi:predicted secreted Zn-dependent protease